MPLYKVVCENCAHEFAGPVNALYCSKACTQQAYRRRKKGEPTMFSEREIALAMKDHHYTTGDQGEMHGLCSCKYYVKHPVEYSA